MSNYGPNPEEAAELARAAGCRVLSVRRMFDGEHAYSIDCPTHKAKLRLLDSLADYDAQTPDVRRMAEYAARLARTPTEQIEALHAFVRDGVTFTREPIETFSPTMHVLEVGAGDCDDSARALVALLRSLGHRARVQTLGDPPQHAAAAVQLDGAWHWLETTIDANPGEHPIAAAQRLGIKMRPDLVASALGQLAQHSNPRAMLDGVQDLTVKNLAISAGFGLAAGAAAVWASSGRDWTKGLVAGATAGVAVTVALAALNG